MSRYRNEDDRDLYVRNDRFQRERPWNYDQPYESREQSAIDAERRDFGRGRFGERANYEYDEPRYNDYARTEREETRSGYGREGRDYGTEPRYYDRATRSRLRCRDIMTRELAVATRDTTLREVAMMMREEDTGVIPIVDYGAGNGDGRAAAADNRLTGSNYGRGKLLGLITDRDIAVRAVAEGKNCDTTRAEELMTTDVHTARPHDRVVDVIRKMGSKQVRRIPIVSESGNLRGIISMGDIAVETEADRELADALEDISRESSFWGRVFG
ncbi:MAG TPA: CBS domain-containing protein [Pyrinomonadaceae bacterium]|nr:CBS domain-containing protein [Pyrinomonadaceae bacterium]